MDQAPGPSIATLAAAAAKNKRIDLSLSFADAGEKAIHACANTIIAPATGVKSPETRKIPAMAAANRGIAVTWVAARSAAPQ